MGPGDRVCPLKSLAFSTHREIKCTTIGVDQRSFLSTVPRHRAPSSRALPSSTSTLAAALARHGHIGAEPLLLFVSCSMPIPLCPLGARWKGAWRDHWATTKGALTLSVPVFSQHNRKSGRNERGGGGHGRPPPFRRGSGRFGEERQTGETGSGPCHGSGRGWCDPVVHSRVLQRKGSKKSEEGKDAAVEEQVEEGGQPEVAGREGGPPSVATPPPNEEDMPADEEDDDDDESKPRGVSRCAQGSLDVDTGHMHDLGPSWSCGNHEHLHHFPREFRCEVPMSVCLVCCTG